MVTLDDVLLIISVFVLITMMVVSSRYLVKEREVERRIKESSEIIQEIIAELKDRLTKQDGNIMDQEIKLEILEMRLTRFLKELPKEETALHQRSQSDVIVSRVPTKGITIKRPKAVTVEKLTDTEREVLLHLSSQGSLTVADLQRLIKVSREHTARLLKKLFEAGYIKRNAEKRPYVYHLTENSTVG